MEREIDCADQLMLRGLNLLAKCRNSAKPRTQREQILKEAIGLMDRSIELEPLNIVNRKFHLRHILGVTMESPYKYNPKIEEGLAFFEKRYDELTIKGKSFFLCAAGDYYVYRGDISRGLNCYYRCTKLSEEDSIIRYAKLMIVKVGNPP